MIVSPFGKKANAKDKLERCFGIVLLFRCLRVVGELRGHRQTKMIDLDGSVAVHDVGGLVAARRFVNVHRHHAMAVFESLLVAFHYDAIVGDAAKFP